METLKEFMLLFRMSPSNEQPTVEQMATMQNQWKNYIGSIASQAKLVNTSRLGFKGSCINPKGQISNNIYISDNQTLSGNMVVKAISLQEAENLAKNCPVLAMGGSVEVRPLIPMEF
ncbi:YCII domain protein [Formosa agariphila KMM 3901]|uniref:YCII domain protein n=1 Tax=Formosa agariphila (strain DSM 15362 / KCTC 12365 / LMG 23005 / KMM 3901 / M-2Alg 35-1) TaxID=1347342 RepID=T2KP88_FORAG|nr:YciI family protein [Formosa agariphila]CDF80271.1 YCII domain protein [Formosa agariphila KMM 3901]